MKKEIFQKVKNNLNKASRTIAERAFLFFLVLVFTGLLVGCLLFYRYSFLAERTELKITETPVQFQENNYQKVLGEWALREKKFQEADTQYYVDPFQSGQRGEVSANEKKLSEERTHELLANPQIQELLKTINLYEFYVTKGETFLTIEERAEIWEELDLGKKEEYQGTYSQNIIFLSELKEELTK